MNTIRSAIVLCFSTILLFGFGYPLLMFGVGQLSPNGAKGLPLYQGNRLVGYRNIGQPFRSPGYFWGRPSAVGYNAAATGGSNKGPTNPEFLSTVKERIDTLLASNPGMDPKEIPVELVTASGSGIDPHISKEGALVQVRRVAAARGLPEEKVRMLVEAEVEGPLFGLFGPIDRINVLKLNLLLDRLEEQTKE